MPDMTSSPSPLARLRSTRLLAIVRSDSEAKAERIVNTLLDCGVDVIEVSLTTPGAVEIIRRASASAPSAFIGAGTVLSRDQTDRVHEAGAQFIVTPAVTESIGRATELGLESFAGVMTPTEALDALGRGATAVKLFPAEVGGAAFLRALRAPLPQVEFIPVGGVTVSKVAEFLDAGAIALGVGSPLTGSPSSEPEVERIAETAQAFRQTIAEWVEADGRR